MATNLDTNTPDTSLSTDIYEISDFIDRIRASNVTDVSETAAMVGMFGYMNEVFSQSLQNELVMVSEYSNETIPTRAKFSRNIIAHALNYGINKIMAEPAVMTLMLYLPVSYMENNFTELNSATGKAKFIFDRKVPIFIGEHEFHLDYDVIITRIKNANGEYVYTAMYDLFESGTTIVKQKNPLSDIYNPYITTIMKCKVDGLDYVAFSARLHQVSLAYPSKSILTDNDIENKSITFTFDEQLASFDVDIEENDKTTHLTPVYSGLIDYSIKSNWCYYEYLDENTIRIVFDRDSYIPGMNAKVTVNVQSTDGSAGNFVYNENFKCAMKSEKYNNYNGMYMLVYPLLGGTSTTGKDKKSIKELKKIIPREASSRGAVINTADLENFFNSINDDSCRIYFAKKRDNPFERLYYAHMLMRKGGNVYPTNTLNLKVLQTDFHGYAGNNNFSIKPGTVFYYYEDGEDNYASVIPPKYEPIEDDELSYNMTRNSNGDLVRVFEYISPFLITIDDDLITSYLLTIMNDNKTFKFDSINTESDLQFIATNMNWSRKFIYKDEDKNFRTYDNKYTMDISITQNSTMDYNLIKYHVDEDTNKKIFDDIRVRMILVLYSDETNTHPYRYCEAKLIDYDKSNHVYDFRFTMETDDLVDLNNRINITGIYNAKPEMLQQKDMLENAHGYMNANTYAKLFIMADFGTKVGDVVDGKKITEETAAIKLYGENGNRNDLETYIPIRQDVIDEFLRGHISLSLPGNIVYNVFNIMKGNKDYMQHVYDYNNDTQQTEVAILKYLRNNKDSDFVQNTLLQDSKSIQVIEAYNYEDFSRYTVTNTFVLDEGLDFYHDYSNMMSSVVNIKQVPKTDSYGNPLHEQVTRNDSYGNTYVEYVPLYETTKNSDGKTVYLYNYYINRIPMLKNQFLCTESKMQDFIYDLEERRKYINACLYVLEDTFNIDLKFFNTYGPSRRFYYSIPSAETFKVIVSVKEIDVLEQANEDSKVLGKLSMNDKVLITKVKGRYGYITSPYAGWIKIADTSRIPNNIDNVALTMKFAVQPQTSADKYITTNIVRDIKEYIEDINEISELHIPNIITLITNNYREQLVYFEFLGVNEYGPTCQHLYYDDSDDAEICPEFINIAFSDDGAESPLIDIAVY